MLLLSTVSHSGLRLAKMPKSQISTSIISQQFFKAIFDRFISIGNNKDKVQIARLIGR